MYCTCTWEALYRIIMEDTAPTSSISAGTFGAVKRQDQSGVLALTGDFAPIPISYHVYCIEM